ncbi:NIF3-like protein 1 [Polyodon spathula]|uniref:NIF3-like protein 1 n=1 Tax=Polyodon spathula TaxID=7913 RepID=UPI001B7DD098|nr:NIF3-like protein 1 [Polyodon spathula]
MKFGSIEQSSVPDAVLSLQEPSTRFHRNFEQQDTPSRMLPPPISHWLSAFSLRNLNRVSCLVRPSPLPAPRNSHTRSGMELKAVVSALEKLAPPSLAESWDNVGLLVEPSPPFAVRSVLLTNDLTEAVLEEALAKKVDFIVSYHPPIFRALKRLTGGWKERVIVKAVEGRVALYSPHTACDCVSGGVNDWLAKAIGPASVSPLSHSLSAQFPGAWAHRVEFSVGSEADLGSILAELNSLQGVDVHYHTARSGAGEQTRVSVNCMAPALTRTMKLLARESAIYRTVQVLQLNKPPVPDAGPGRICTLSDPVTIATAVQRIKTHLRLSHVRLALGARCTLDSLVLSVAVCAGSGSSVLNGVPADLFLTGEMSHHDVLDAVAVGTSVVLCDHSNSERGFLSELKEALTGQLEGKVKVQLSETDRDPLEIV